MGFIENIKFSEEFARLKGCLRYNTDFNEYEFPSERVEAVLTNFSIEMLVEILSDWERDVKVYIEYKVNEWLQDNGVTLTEYEYVTLISDTQHLLKQLTCLEIIRRGNNSGIAISE